MNVHHLELFYYVAKFEGITQAVRKMPYGIQQPAVSGQILQLEKDLSVKLFHRRPFALTPAGQELYDFVYPFFSRLDETASRLKGEESQTLRLAASAAVLTNHLPRVLELIRRDYPELRLILKEIQPGDVEALLQRQEADVAISILHTRVASGIKTRKLLELPLVLLAPADRGNATWKSLVDDAENGVIREPLISLPSYETIPMMFQDELARLGLQWPVQVEVNTLELVHTYVANGFGFGITVKIPALELPGSVREIRLPGFEKLVVGLLHLGNLKPVCERFCTVSWEYSRMLLQKRVT